MEEIKNHQVGEEEISLRDLILNVQDWIAYLWSRWLIILIVGLLGGAIGLLVSVLQKPTYVARLTFVLEDEKGGGMGSLGGLAAMAGINMGSGGGGIFQGENILDLYQSRTMLRQTLLSSTPDNDSLLIERYLRFTGIQESWENNDQAKKLAMLDFKVSHEQFSLQHDSITGEVIRSIQKNHLSVSRPDRQKSLIEVRFSSENEGFSKDFTEALVREVNEFYVQTRTKKSQQNLNILEHQVDSVRRELDAALAGVAVSQDANPNANPARRVLSVGSSRRQVDVQANQAILTELVRNQELAKVTLRNETPLIQVVDRPVLPLEMEYLGKLKGIVIGGVVGGFLILGVLISRRYYREIMGEPVQ